MKKNVGASVRARLLNKAKESGLDYNLLLTRYALERMLYRLSRSPHADQFLLKGALLFDLWFDMPTRPTRDADFLGFGDADTASLTSVFKSLCEGDLDDGIRFDRGSVKADEIRKDSHYAGVRVTLLGWLDGARCEVQADVGFGDAVTPAAEFADYPVLLDDMPKPRLRVYPTYTVIAEKTEALVSLGMTNTRMKDFFDLLILSRQPGLDPVILKRAVRATFERRRTPMPTAIPLGLSDEFANDRAKLVQWNAFLKKNKLTAPPLPEVVRSLREFLTPLLSAE